MKTSSLTVTPIQAFATITVVNYLNLANAVLTVAGTALVEGADWTAATSNGATATSLASAIGNLAQNYTSVAVGAVITVTQQNVGTPIPADALATSDAVNLTISGSTIAGGTLGVVGTSGRAKTLYGLSMVTGSGGCQMNIYDGTGTSAGVVLNFYPDANSVLNLDFGQGIVFQRGLVVELVPDDTSHIPTQVSLRFIEI